MPDDLKKEKAALRSEMRSLMSTLPTHDFAEKSMSAQRVLLDSTLWHKAATIAIYASMPTEAGTDMLFAMAMEEGRTLLLPRIINMNSALMEFAVCKSSADLEQGPYGIAQPRQGEAWHEPPDLLLVPGLAFDPQGHRLGHGGGYYDRFLACNPAWQMAACGFCLGVQIIGHIPHDIHDCQLKFLTSDEGLQCL